jgi:hypothetical protein
MVNGTPLAAPDALVAALRLMGPWSGYHHTHPAQTYEVQVLTSQGTLDLVLRRDSEDRREYWVFIPSSARRAARIAATS